MNLVCHKFPLLVGAVILALCAPAKAQQSGKVPRIGVVFIGGREQPHLDSFKQGLRELGYVEGKNIVLEYRYAEGKYDRLPSLVTELVHDKVDVIVTTSSISARAARQVTRTIPIVMTSGSPVERGLAESFSKPGGNVTGLSVFALELSGKRLELLKEMVPKMTRVAALWSSSENESALGFKETQDAAKDLSLGLLSVELPHAGEMEKTLGELKKARPDALLVVISPLVTLNSKRIVEFALKQRLPGMYPTRQFVDEGGLMAYGPLLGDLYRRAATYVDKILKGANPADLPVEQPKKFEFDVNLKTAKQIGLTIPPNVLARADRVIK
jgi:putative ABC transport system substrate-binding protein